MMIKPQVLILSGTLDFSTDLVCSRLRSKGVEFLRLNRDQLGEYEIILEPYPTLLTVKSERDVYVISEESLKSVYYRAPTFLREVFSDPVAEEEQLYRTQWAAFVRSLIIFENAKWVNHPSAIYSAEMKPLQLRKAVEAGLLIPTTILTNVVSNDQRLMPFVALKSLDTAIINKGDEEAFVYTTVLRGTELLECKYNSPFFLQEGLIPKLDIRVTVIRDQVIAVKIAAADAIDIDWRKYKGELMYEIFKLPSEIEQKCVAFARNLNLVFAAIDMIFYREQLYFIEVNPTGEWGWLQKNTGCEIDLLITKCLANE